MALYGEGEYNEVGLMLLEEASVVVLMVATLLHCDSGIALLFVVSALPKG